MVSCKYQSDRVMIRAVFRQRGTASLRKIASLHDHAWNMHERTVYAFFLSIPVLKERKEKNESCSSPAKGTASWWKTL